jgi:iron complex transport system permease protein
VVKAGPPVLRTVGLVRRRRVVLLVCLALLLVVAVLASFAFGAKQIALAEVWSAIFSPTGSNDHVVVRTVRVPRTILGLAVGAALGVAGALMQGHTRNPLADPGLLGVSAGAAFSVVLGIYALGVTSLFGYVWLSLAGAMVASVVVFLLGMISRDGPTPVMLALAGVCVSALLQAFVSALVLQNAATLDAYRFWAVGSIAGRDGEIALQVAPFLAAGLLLALLNAPGLNVMALGEDVARGLGVDTGRVRWIGLSAVTLLTGAAVAACGPIGFVGLVVPHVCRIFTGPDYRWLVPASALAGPVLLLGADIVGRLVLWPAEVPVGIVLVLLGTPFFIAIVRRQKAVSL